MCSSDLKQSIVKSNESDKYQNNRFTIFVQPGINPIYNGPGLPLELQSNEEGEAFNVNLEESGADITPEVLTKFNPLSGGLLLPRGTSLKGLDLRKTILRPTYVPTYYNWLSGTGKNQPWTGILKWTGNCLISDTTFKDKIGRAHV